ncbi:helix-turn-helix transcriptional regulator [Arcanobacterium haemolyticum]|nr:helix-turn-helix transcriptional regulator [Arcanobacterium haemolyticum]
MTSRNTPTDPCPIAQSLAILGEKWTLLILRDIFRGMTRFKDLEEDLGCPKAILSSRLTKLTEAGILTKTPYHEAGSRPRFSYALTPSGSELIVVLAAFQEWGIRHIEGTKPSLVGIHRECGAPVNPALRCSAGHLVQREDIELRIP